MPNRYALWARIRRGSVRKELRSSYDIRVEPGNVEEIVHAALKGRGRRSHPKETCNDFSPSRCRQCTPRSSDLVFLVGASTRRRNVAGSAMLSSPRRRPEISEPVRYPSLRAKRSNPGATSRGPWVASSQELLAMTGGRLSSNRFSCYWASPKLCKVCVSTLAVYPDPVRKAVFCQDGLRAGIARCAAVYGKPPRR
jgi:hypothetical protein